jgi:hypothetical protein
MDFLTFCPSNQPSDLLFNRLISVEKWVDQSVVSDLNPLQIKSVNQSVKSLKEVQGKGMKKKECRL